MPVIDFCEIPGAHLSGGQQDSFEQFAAEFLQLLGFVVIEWPSRGADGGKDFVVEEVRKGIVGENRIRHLVSCKHKAFSGKSVSPGDESNISDRVRANNCSAFIGIYSTIPSTGLVNILKNLRIEARWFDGKRVERDLLVPKGMQLARRYFPRSTTLWVNENPVPLPVFGELKTLRCEICDKNLLDRITFDSFLGGVLEYCISGADIYCDKPQIVDVKVVLQR